jgi:hypothetical protein
MPETEPPPSREPDHELDRVFRVIAAIPGFAKRSAKTIRKAVDGVLRGESTARYSIHQLTPEEKKHIGTQVECELKREFFKDRKGKRLDTSVEDVDVDIKNTIRDNWMIPPEAVGALCLLSLINEDAATYSIGVVRAWPELLTSENQDKKRPLSRKGKDTITWLIERQSLPVSLFLANSHVRERVFAKASGQTRVAELFRIERDKPIQRSDIAVAAAYKERRQVDLRARVRDAKNTLMQEGLLVLRGWNKSEREEAAGRGSVIDSDQCICLSPVPSGSGA